MVMKIEPLVTALEGVQPARCAPGPVQRPRRHRFTQAVAHRLADLPSLVLVCGRYEGVDERISSFVDEQLCIGDYVLSAAKRRPRWSSMRCPAWSRRDRQRGLAARGVVQRGPARYPQYTRPEVFRDMRPRRAALRQPRGGRTLAPGAGRGRDGRAPPDLLAAARPRDSEKSS